MRQDCDRMLRLEDSRLLEDKLVADSFRVLLAYITKLHCYLYYWYPIMGSSGHSYTLIALIP